MSRLKTQIIWGMLMIAIWTESITASKINTTIYDTNLAHVTYSDTLIKCNRWVNSWVFWKACDSWLKPWTSGVYHSQGRMWSFHSSLNHQLASVAIEFKGTDAWVYGPPSSQLAEFPPNYKICLYENHRLSSKSECYQINIKDVYSSSLDEDQPLLVFARGQLQNHEHRIVISVADPVDDLQAHNGIMFSHLVYTGERPTPWPAKEDSWRYREVVMHDTHPLLSYSPPVSSNPLAVTPAWSAKIHTAEDGTVVSWHELRSHNEGDPSQWGVGTKIKAGAVAIYGAPSAYVDETRYSLGFVCVRLDLGPCEMVDLKIIYANQRHEYEPVLLWRNDGLDASHETHISIHLVKLQTGIATVFPFKSINYFEEKEYSSPGLLFGNFQNVTVEHDDRAIAYSPGKRCVVFVRPGVCATWFDPWELKEVGPSGSVLSYRATRSRYRVKDDPHIILHFKATSVYLYGAPSAYAGRPFAPQHVCLNNSCRVIDVEQAYLHSSEGDMESASVSEARSQNATSQDIIAPFSIPHPELEPVLIWSIKDLDNEVENTLRLALAALPSPDHAEMSYVKLVYTKASYGFGGRPDKPAPQPDHAYEGPLHPPYAMEWAPQDHKPLPPPVISTDPPPGQSPFLKLLLFSFALLAVYYCTPRIRRFWRSNAREAEPLLPGQPSNGRNNARNGPFRTGWGCTPGSPPRYSNATDIPPNYSAASGH